MYYDRRKTFSDFEITCIITCNEFIEVCWHSLVLCFDLTGTMDCNCNLQLLFERSESDLVLMPNFNLITFTKGFFELFERDTEHLLESQNFLQNKVQRDRCRWTNILWQLLKNLLLVIFTILTFFVIVRRFYYVARST